MGGFGKKSSDHVVNLEDVILLIYLLCQSSRGLYKEREPVLWSKVCGVGFNSRRRRLCPSSIPVLRVTYFDTYVASGICTQHGFLSWSQTSP